jgi:hypothetical protein
VTEFKALIVRSNETAVFSGDQNRVAALGGGESRQTDVQSSSALERHTMRHPQADRIQIKKQQRYQEHLRVIGAKGRDGEEVCRRYYAMKNTCSPTIICLTLGFY